MLTSRRYAQPSYPHTLIPSHRTPSYRSPHTTICSHPHTLTSTTKLKPSTYHIQTLTLPYAPTLTPPTPSPCSDSSSTPPSTRRCSNPPPVHPPTLVVTAQ